MYRTSKPLVAGWLNITAGILWLLAVGLLALVIQGFSVGFGAPQGAAAVRLVVLLVALTLPGLLAIAGGICSLKRRIFLLALTGAVSAIPCGLGIASIVLLLQAKKEFS